MSDIAIQVDHLSKQYRIGSLHQGGSKYKSLREELTKAVRAPIRRAGRLLRGEPYGAAELDETIWALKDVSFEIEHGEAVGIIGPNGAGKTTLLKILSRITEPSEGRAVLHGRVGSLLEVGTGFHPELTGRENTYLNGAILGMTKTEIQRKFDEIVEFSGVEQFIDTPVKHYSSGMRVRLAFSVAAHLDPEVLLIDEVLAVGDAGFQKKCLAKMDEVAQGGRTVLFVSHNVGMINSLCTRAVLLNGGEVKADGVTSEVVARYFEGFGGGGIGEPGELRFGIQPDLPFQVLALRLLDETGKPSSRFDLFEEITVELDYVIREPIEGSHLAVVVLHQGEWILPTWDTDTAPERFHERQQGRYQAKLTLPSPLLKAGRYQVRAGMGISNVRGVHNPDTYLAFDVLEESMGTSLVSFAGKRPGKLAIPIDWRIENLSLAEAGSAYAE